MPPLPSVKKRITPSMPLSPTCFWCRAVDERDSPALEVEGRMLEQRLCADQVPGDAVHLVGLGDGVAVSVPQSLLDQVDGEVGDVDPDPAALQPDGRIDGGPAAAEGIEDRSPSRLLAWMMRSISFSGFCVG